MNLVDSSGWLEHFAGASNAPFFGPPLGNQQSLLVPTICIAEVFKKLLTQKGEDIALFYAVQMKRAVVVELDYSIAVAAARLGVQFNLAMADSIILATAQSFHATLWTQDADFDGIPGVQYIKK